MARLNTANFRSRGAMLAFLLTAVIGLTADLWTKHLAYVKFSPSGVTWDDRGRVEIAPHDPYVVIPHVLHFRFMANQGAVFGIGQGMRWLFLSVSVGAILFIVYLFLTSERHRFYQFILGLLLAGVMGNMYDRVRLGYVRDMIQILPTPIGGKELFPWIFNLADTYLCVGVALIFLYSLRGPRDEKAKDAQKPAEAATA